MRRFLRLMLLSVLGCLLLSVAGAAQDPPGKGNEPTKQPVPNKEELSPVPAKVEVQPVARDEEIGKRLQSVLDATGWFKDPKVEVSEGVVFLSGETETDELKKWAGDLARNTQDVAAVANRMTITQPSVWDFRAAWGGVSSMWRDFLLALPFIIFGLLILVASVVAGWFATRWSEWLLYSRVRANLLRAVLARAAGTFVFLAGVYVILRVSGLTQLALTIIGGTGLVGLALGIAFRDITENFLASVFLSMQRPFETGDLVEVAGVTGFVQQLNVRTTILMNLQGNLVQVPNATIYKSTILNLTANPNRREDFLVGIGYDDVIDVAQEVARKVLAEHPAVLNDPEPSVLVESLGDATVNLRVYFWMNGQEHSNLKVRSSVIRLVKRAFQQRGISMPDAARELIFPQGIPVTLLEGVAREKRQPVPAGPTVNGHEPVSTQAEGGLSSEAGVIKGQASQLQVDADENLLRGTPPTSR